jgi:excisionase family DNA binding protein
MRNNTDKKAKKYVSVAELAKMLGISRIAVFKRIKKGQVPAEKIGRSYVISSDFVSRILPDKNRELTEKDKNDIEKTVKKVVKEYGQTLRLLGGE